MSNFCHDCQDPCEPNCGTPSYEDCGCLTKTTFECILKPGTHAALGITNDMTGKEALTALNTKIANLVLTGGGGTGVGDNVTINVTNGTISAIVDTVPVNGSNKLITSNAVFDGLALKVDKSLTINGNPLTSNITLTKASIGLASADDTPDSQKPVSQLQAAAIAVVQGNLTTHAANVNNPHGVTKAQVGLPDVENYSSANLPLSIAASAAIATKQATLVSGSNIKTINGQTILGAGDITISGSGSVTVDTTLSSSSTNAIANNAVFNGLAGKQATLVNQTNIKSINGQSILGSGDLVISTSGTVDSTIIDGSSNPVQGNAVFDALVLKANAFNAALTGVPTAPNPTLGTNNQQLATTFFVNEAIDATNIFFHEDDFSGAGTALNELRVIKDTAVVSGSIKPITSGAVFDALAAKQANLVSGTTIKTINGASVLGSGDIVINTGGTVDTVLADGSANAISNNAVFDALGTKQATLVSATNIKTVNGQSILGSGDLTISGPDLSAYATLANPALTGNPTAPTPAFKDNDTSIATSAFVQEAKQNATYKALSILGNPIKALTVGVPYAFGLKYGREMFGSNMYLAAIYLDKAATLTGAGIGIEVTGNFISGGYNGVVLYTLSGTTLTEVASSVSNPDMYRVAGGTLSRQPFTTPYVATEGLYYVGFHYTDDNAPTTKPQFAIVNAAYGNYLYKSGTTAGLFISGVHFGAGSAKNTTVDTTVVDKGVDDPMFALLY